MISTARPEDQLLMCVARRWPDAAKRERVHSFVQCDLDWEYLLAMARRHSLIPLLHCHLSSVADAVVPQHVLSQLRDSSQENARRGLFLTAELLKLLDSLESHGINAIPFKGPTLALAAYGDVGLRQFGDLDILVHQQEVLRVKELLTSRGFKPTPELTNAQEAALLRFDSAYNFENEQGVVLDVHWDFVARYFSVKFDANQLWDRLEPISVGRKQLLTLSPEDLIMVLCLHGFTHLWERLGWICDLANLIERRKDIEWQVVLQSAAIVGGRRILSLGLFLANELLEAPVPKEVWEILPPDSTVRTVAAQIQEQLFAEGDGLPGFIDGVLLHLRMRERKRDRLISCVRFAVTPRSYDWMLLPLPKWLFFLYYPLRPLRLVGKYGAKLLKGSTRGVQKPID